MKAKRLLSLMLSLITLFSALSVSTAAFADAHPDGWALEEDGWHFYLDGGQPFNEDIGVIDGKGYYFDYHGVMQTGWILKEYQLTNNTTDESYTQVIWYYAASNGVLAESWRQISGIWYYFEPGGYYMYSGGMFNIAGKPYIFKSSGAMITGWYHNTDKSGYIVYDTWYYADASGALATGWRQVGGKWYYFDPTDYYMYANTSEKIGGKIYCFTSSGAMVANGWMQSRWGDWYYADASGALATGWKQIKGTWYYFDTEEGFMYVGGHKIGSKLYLFDGSGAWVNMKSGWKQVNITVKYDGKSETYTHWYYFKNSAIATGWQKISGKWYFFDGGSGYMYKSGAFKTNDSRVYFFDSSGAMVTSTCWAKETYGDGSYDWFYVNSNGVCTTGWKTINKKDYYFDLDGAYMYTGVHTIDGVTYSFAGTGECLGVVN